MICLFDGSEHPTLEALHAHLRVFKWKQADYYTQFYPRTCLGTGKPIPFKNREQYLSQDFIDKNAIKAYIKKSPKEAREWAIGWLKKRKEEKGLVYAPSQVELRSLSCPSMLYYDSVGGYYNITRELGFKDRYRNEGLSFGHPVTQIIQDTREQLPLKLGVQTTVAKLNAGDYGLAQNDVGVYIERKGLGDFVGTLNCRKITRKKGDDSSFERFDRELARATENGHYVVMLAETPLTQALSFSYLPQMKWTKVSEQHVFKNLRDLLTKYPLTFQAVFADGRVDAANKVVKILGMGNQVRNIDLQYANEKGLL